MVPQSQWVSSLASFDADQAAKLLDLQITVLDSLTQFSTPAEGIPIVLGRLCGELDWSVAVLWVVDKDRQNLRCHTYWSDSRDAQAELARTEFEILSRNLRFPKRIGIPGRVWASGQAAWVEDVRKDLNFPRYRAAQVGGVCSGYCIPLRSNGEILGVLEFFSDRVEALGEIARHSLEMAGRQIALHLWNDRIEQSKLRSDETARSQEDLIDVLTHEIRNPLNIVLLNALLIERHLTPESLGALPEEIRPSRIIGAAREIQTLIEDVGEAHLTLDARKKSLQLEEHTAARVILDVLCRMRSSADQKGVRLESQLPLDSSEAAIASLYYDVGKVLRVLQNLVSNALKFTPSGGVVQVGFAQSSVLGKLVFFVKDTGCGIAPENLPYVFERRWQAPETAHLGKGLGLWIAQDIVQSHGGAMWVDSQPGQGATFSFTLEPSGANTAEH